jgi:hypothetical protein
MKKIVEFQSQEAAKKLAKYFYGVELNECCLTFANFDKLAFDLAVGLEGLNASAYRLIGEESKVFFLRLEVPSLADRFNLLGKRLRRLFDNRLSVIYFVSTIPKIQLEILFLIEKAIYSYTFTLPLNPDPLSSSIQPIEPNEFLLAPDWQLYSLIDMLQNDPLGKKQTTIIALEKASLKIGSGNICTIAACGENISDEYKSKEIAFVAQVISVGLP